MSLDKRLVLVIGGGTDSISLIQKLRYYDYHVIVVDRDKECPAAKYSDQLLLSSTHCYNSILEKTRDLSVSYSFVRSSGVPAVCSARLNEYFCGSLAASSELIDLLQDKFEMSRVVDGSVRTPRTWSDSSEICNWGKR